MSTSSVLRIGNTERESACRALDQHFAEGRLDPDEYSERYARASSARVVGDFHELFADLPQPHPSAAPAAPAPSRVSLRKSRTTEHVPAPRRDWFGMYLTLRWLLLIAALITVGVMFEAGWVAWIVVPLLFCGGGRRRHRRDWERQHQLNHRG